MCMISTLCMIWSFIGLDNALGQGPISFSCAEPNIISGSCLVFNGKVLHSYVLTYCYNSEDNNS
jgi:hypothetical protein